VSDATILFALFYHVLPERTSNSVAAAKQAKQMQSVPWIAAFWKHPSDLMNAETPMMRCKSSNLCFCGSQQLYYDAPPSNDAEASLASSGCAQDCDAILFSRVVPSS